MVRYDKKLCSNDKITLPLKLHIVSHILLLSNLVPPSEDKKCFAQLTMIISWERSKLTSNSFNLFLCFQLGNTGRKDEKKIYKMCGDKSSSISEL